MSQNQYHGKAADADEYTIASFVTGGLPRARAVITLIGLGLSIFR
jgi:hypothetical protein